MALMDIPHVLHAHVEMECQTDGSVEAIVVVETDLELDASRPNYNKATVEKLLADLSNQIMGNPQHAGKVRVRTAP